MSNRAFRRLQGQAEIIIPNLTGAEDGSSPEEEDVAVPVKKKGKGKKKHIANPFELLNEAADGDGDKDEEVEEEDEDKSQTHAVSDSQPAGAAAAGKKKKKNKKKKKTTAENASAAAAEPVEDDIEASIEEVNRMFGSTQLSTGDGASQPHDELTVNMKALLNVEYKYLNADNEMKRKFGARVVQGEQGRGRHRNHRTQQRQGRLVQPKDNWPMVGKSGLSMVALEKRPSLASGEQCFSFEHNQQYQQVQFQFLEAVQSYNPQNITTIIQEHPYHVDSLLQLSEVFHVHEDPQTAVDLVERALYVFEMAFHPRFNIAAGNCRLDFRRQENRPFFLALFKHLMAVGQRGCHRTALELCKLLLSLDPDGDPMGVILMIDYYALRAEEYSFLVRLFEEWESFRNLSQLPNFAFSVPLAMFHLSKSNNSILDKANRMLEDSLLMFPGLLMTLLDKCGVSADNKVTGHSFFGPSAQSSQTPALKQLSALYVGRCHLLWKEPEVILWLEKVVKQTLELVNAKDPRVKTYAEKRKVRYQGTPREIYRHFIISNIKDATATLPPELTNTSIMSYDPLPPLDAIVSYSPPPRARPAAGQRESALTLFMRSLLPNFNAQHQNLLQEEREMGEVMVAEEEGAVGGGNPELRQARVELMDANQELRRGVGALMDAMRDLLNNIRMTPPPVENGQNPEGGGPNDGGGGNGDEEEDNAEWD